MKQPNQAVEGSKKKKQKLIKKKTKKEEVTPQYNTIQGSQGLNQDMNSQVNSIDIRQIERGGSPK